MPFTWPVASLSDAKLEDALDVRLDFAVFCGFNSNDTLPDKATHCRFWTAIFESGVIDELLANRASRKRRQKTKNAPKTA